MDNLKKAKSLKAEGEILLYKLKLLEILSRVGKAEVVGSMNLDLMVYRDIDIEVVVTKLDRLAIESVLKNLTAAKTRRIDFSLIDNSVNSKEKFPKGIYLGIKCHLGMDWVPDFPKNEETWKIDIWFVKSANARSSQMTQKIKSKLTGENRKIILKLKNLLYKKAGYPKIFNGLDVYRAVLEEGVSDIKSLENYLKIK